MCVTRFLLRWLYLNRLIIDWSDVHCLLQIDKSEKYTSHQCLYHEQNIYPKLKKNGENNPKLLKQKSFFQKQIFHNENKSIQNSQSNPPYQNTSSKKFLNHSSKWKVKSKCTSKKIKTKQDIFCRISDSEWKTRTLRGISLYPPGSKRLLALDALRMEIACDFARDLKNANEIIKKYSNLDSSFDKVNNFSSYRHLMKEDKNLHCNENVSEENRNKPIFRFKKKICNEKKGAEIFLNNLKPDCLAKDNDILIMSPKASGIKAYSNQERNFLLKENYLLQDGIYYSKLDNEEILNLKHKLIYQIDRARKLQSETRDCLPQLVSVILHSPSAFNYSNNYFGNPDPLSYLRHLLITQCIHDPNLGIEFCWLLEAEVGPTLKSLFEDRQKSGNRIIIVLPLERRAVISKIGVRKQSAFDLLQDVECATAYGMYTGGDSALNYIMNIKNWNINRDKLPKYGITSSLFNTSSRFSTSLSVKRCSYFGDTMHFIDRLTKISLDLRLVPNLQRREYLEKKLGELNRRLRRRMVTNGEVSLNIEDNRGLFDWPTNDNVTVDMIHFSIHLPLEPIDSLWQEYKASAQTRINKHKVMRVLNVVRGHSRLLASRYRCPFLVYCEVVETDLEGSDIQLYTSGTRITNNQALFEHKLSMTSKHRFANFSENIISAGQMKGFLSYPIHFPLIVGKESKKEYSIGNVIISDEKVDHYSHIKPNLLNNKINSNHTFSKSRGRVNESFQTSPTYNLSQPQSNTLLHYYYHSQSSSQNFSVRRSSPSFTTYTALLDRVFGVQFSKKCESIRRASPYGKLKGWRLASFVVKAGEDLRRDALVMQIITKLQGWFKKDIQKEYRPYLRPYTIMCVGVEAGLLEVVNDAKSVDEVKKETDRFISLRNYFERAYGLPFRGYRCNSTSSIHQYNSQTFCSSDEKKPVVTFETAQDNFLRSLVGYSLVCYILQIKDRHNANILLDREGHLMHIDFGFILGDTPKMGKVPLFSERAPFKLSAEFWEVLGGWDFTAGGLSIRFCKIFEEAFACASKHSEEILILLETALISLTESSNNARTLTNGVKARLRMRGDIGSVEQKKFIMNLVITALNSWGTCTYDWLQKSMNGYI